MIRETRMLIYQAFFSVFPIYTGVILVAAEKATSSVSLPHIYGSYSYSGNSRNW